MAPRRSPLNPKRHNLIAADDYRLSHKRSSPVSIEPQSTDLPVAFVALTCDY